MGNQYLQANNDSAVTIAVKSLHCSAIRILLNDRNCIRILLNDRNRIYVEDLTTFS